MRKTLLDGITRYFYFSLQDRKGIVILSAICFGTFLTPIFMRLYTEKNIEVIDFSAERKLVLQLEGQSPPIEDAANLPTAPLGGELFSFDPNTATIEEFMRLGLSTKTARTIENYRSKGGKFRKVEDFAKIWSITKADFDRLQPFIDIHGKKAPMANVSERSENVKRANLHTFDPNTASETDLVQLGLASNTIKSILNYRSKGGKFRNSADLKKIYTLSEKDFARIEPYILIQSSLKTDDGLPVMSSYNSGRQFPNNNEAQPYSISIVIDINTADVMEWQKLKGIGPTLSKRIATYRAHLGGFYSIDQVSETYNLPDSTFQAIKANLKISMPVQLQKININTASQEQLVLHPYIGKKESLWITGYRLQHGNYKSTDDVVKALPKIDTKWLEKIRMYLEI